MDLLNTFASLFSNFGNLTWQMVVMWGIGALLIYLAIAKKMEPSLLLPMGFGAILVNLPLSGAITQGDTVGPISALFEAGMSNELFPLLLFIGIGAMIDFGPLLEKPWLMLFGAAAQFGIFFTLFLAGFFFDLKDAASIAVIGAADGPTAIFVANTLNSQYLGAIMVAAYSYMALVPIVQPPVIRLLTTQKERRIRMPYEKGNVTQLTKILFPVVVTVVAGLVAPASVALVGFLMFGNLLRECGVLNSLSETAQNVLANLITLLLGLSVSFRMQAEAFLTWQTLLILALFGVLCVVMAVVPSKARKAGHGVYGFLHRRRNSTSQTFVRVTVVLLIGLVTVSAVFDLDIVLGAFAAGFVLRYIIPEGDHELESKLDAIGYGFLTPVFFVVSGAKIDLAGVGAQPGLLITFICALLLVRAVPIMVALSLGRDAKALSMHNRITVALYCTTALPIIVAVTSLAVKSGAMAQETAGVLVAAGAITVFLMPLLASLTYRVVDAKPIEAVQEIVENPQDIRSILHEHLELEHDGTSGDSCAHGGEGAPGRRRRGGLGRRRLRATAPKPAQASHGRDARFRPTRVCRA